MIKRLKNILSVFLIIVLLFASGGYNIFKHFCLKEKSLSYSIFAPKTCEHDNVCLLNQNAETKTPPCCKTHQKKKDLSYSQFNNLSKKCCSNEHSFLKTDLFVFHKTHSISNNISSLFLITHFNFSLNNLFFQKSAFNFHIYIPPPTFVGKILILFLHQLKFADPL